MTSVLAEFLRDMREKAGITQKELAKEMGISRSMVASIEKGRRRVTDDMHMKWVTTVRDVARRRAKDVGAI